MSVYERSVRVDAPLADVWEFHSTGDGLEALTPDWMNLVIEESRGPDGEPDPDVLTEGSVIVSSVRPLGVGPRQTWTSEIVAREESDEHAMFRDHMTEGPFAHWLHTHRFVAEGDATLVHDRIEYQFPGGPLGKAIGPFAYVGFEPMFRYRHRTTRQLLE
ncbi:SRPBCC family protein [Halomicrobium sp. LC1Hm]|uniref:SRPBCC family protein n=1 Tax=Halomicrobium sp. LC1Hm TaxID=2610902 RepID=UPI001298356E|nr:SRPBCC family protein [Halomicrobium sp. LC1Hm]QGA83486.1 Lipid binding protein [Halomicrobium sp. LC1Hm]